MSYFKPPKAINKVSDTTRDNGKFYAGEKAAALTRARRRCEGCGAGNVVLDPHHVFGRRGTGARLGTPYCNMREVLAMICRPCHTAITDGKDPALDLRLKRLALERLGQRLEIVALDVEEGTSVDYVGAAREMVRIAVERERTGGPGLSVLEGKTE